MRNKYIGDPFSEEDYTWAENMYGEIWKRLDHSQHYCINPKTMIGELLRRHNKTVYQTWWP
jgi:hypothetical protein